MLSTQEKLFQYIDTHLHSYIDELVQIGSNFTIHPSANPLLTLLTQLFQHANIESQLLDMEAPLIYAAHPGNGASSSLLLYNSCPVLSSISSSQSYLTLVIRQLAALKAYEDVTGSSPINLSWLIDLSPEPGNLHLESIITEQLDFLHPDACLYSSYPFLSYHTPVLAPGTKGLLRVRLSVQTLQEPLSSMHGAIAPNALWRLTWALNSLKDAHEEILIEGFYDTLTSAEDEEIELLYTLPDMTSSLMQTWKLDTLLLGLKGFQLQYAHLLTPSCTLGNIWNDSSRDRGTLSIPAKASAELDFHLVPGQQPDDIFAKLQSHLTQQGFSDIHVEKLLACPPIKTPLTTPFVQSVLQALASTDSPPLLLPLSPASSTLGSLHKQFQLPVVVVYLDYQHDETDSSNILMNRTTLIRGIKQLALLFEDMQNYDATHTTQ